MPFVITIIITSHKALMTFTSLALSLWHIYSPFWSRIIVSFLYYLFFFFIYRLKTSIVVVVLLSWTTVRDVLVNNMWTHYSQVMTHANRVSFLLRRTPIYPALSFSKKKNWLFSYLKNSTTSSNCTTNNRVCSMHTCGPSEVCDYLRVCFV